MARQKILCTMGMFIIDQFEFMDENGQLLDRVQEEAVSYIHITLHRECTYGLADWWRWYLLSVKNTSLRRKVICTLRSPIRRDRR